MNYIKYQALTCAVMATLILTSCDAPKTPSATDTTKNAISQTKSYDPCELLTAADLTAAFPGAVPVLDRHDEEPNPIGMKICYYSNSEKDMNFAQLAVVSAADAPKHLVEYNSLKPLFENEKALLTATDIQVIAGLGDEAYYGGSGLKPGAGLHVLDNGHGVKIDILVGLGSGNDDPTEHIRIEKELAEKALSRL